MENVYYYMYVNIYTIFIYIIMDAEVQTFSLHGPYFPILYTIPNKRQQVGR